MRNPPNDPELTLDPSAERRCILTGVHDDRARLIRLALSPHGVLVPDIAARAPGRGAWIGVDAAQLAEAQAKGKLKGALARAFKGTAAAVPDDLAGAINDAFSRLVLAQLGMAAKAGALLTGADKIDNAARAGQVRLLLHAADAASDGRRKRDQSWRVGEDAEGSGQMGMVLPLDRASLSQALGRDNAVHLALIEAGWADRLGTLLQRWHHFATWPMGAAIVPRE
jgi:uncharacterized protein